MPIQTDLAVNTYFFGADPPAIPFQLTPAADLTAASMAFYIWPLGVALEGQGPLITATTGNGMIVTSGPNTDITSGSFYVQITLVAWAALTASSVGVTKFRYELWRTDSGNVGPLAYGSLPVIYFPGGIIA